MSSILKSFSVWFSLSVLALGCSIRPASLPAPVEPQHKILYSPPKPVNITLKNGLNIYYLQDKDLPIASGTLFLPSGTLTEGPYETGLVSALGPLMRDGGAGKMTADELDLFLRRYAARISSGFNQEYGSISFSCLAGDLETVFPVFSDVLLKPRFEKPRVTLWQEQYLDGISRRKDDIDTIAGIAFQQLLFPHLPEGRVISSNNVKNITEAALQRMHRRVVSPEGAILAMTGPAPYGEAVKLAKKFFGSWRSGLPLRKLDDSERWLPLAKRQQLRGAYFVEAPFTQAVVMMGSVGPRRQSNDEFAVKVLNEIFGSGGLSSTLMQKVRTDAGLAYSTWGIVSPGKRFGSNQIYLRTKAQSVGEAIRYALMAMHEVQSSLVADDILMEKKDTISNSFVFKFDSSADILARRALIELLGYPADFDNHYIERVLDVTSLDVQIAAQTYWKPDDFTVLVVGPREIYHDLKKFFDNPPEGLPRGKLKKLEFKEELKL